MQVDIKKRNQNNYACVIGNGPSRLQFDLHQIHASLVTYGCNAIYRDFMPDYLISMDFTMVHEILESKAHYHTKFYTQYDSKVANRINNGEPIYYATQDKWIGDSGSGALRLALMNGHSKVYMIGFDYTGLGTKINNVYYGTKNYMPHVIENQNDMLLRQWESRLRHHCKTYSNIEVIRVDGVGYKPNCKESNFNNITVEQFKEILNEL